VPDLKRSESESVDPVSCPFCRWHYVNTTDKAVTHSNYLRCAACGEIWHPARSQELPHRRLTRPW
jgi:hypothetical protein